MISIFFNFMRRTVSPPCVHHTCNAGPGFLAFRFGTVKTRYRDTYDRLRLSFEGYGL